MTSWLVKLFTSRSIRLLNSSVLFLSLFSSDDFFSLSSSFFSLLLFSNALRAASERNLLLLVLLLMPSTFLVVFVACSFDLFLSSRSSSNASSSSSFSSNSRLRSSFFGAYAENLSFFLASVFDLNKASSFSLFNNFSRFCRSTSARKASIFAILKEKRRLKKN